MQRLAVLLISMSTWRSALLATLVYAFFLVQVMAPQGAQMTALAGSWGAPDGHFFYTPDELYAAVGTWPGAARDAYIKFRLGLDPLWALTYTAWLVAFTGLGLRHTTQEESRWRVLVMLPLVPMVADLVENALGIALIQALPESNIPLAWAASCITAGKWLTLALAHVVMLIALLGAGIRRIRAM